MDSSNAAGFVRARRVQPAMTWASVGLLAGAGDLLWSAAQAPVGVHPVSVWFALGLPAVVGAAIGLQLGPALRRPTPGELRHGALWVGGGGVSGAFLGALTGLFSHPFDAAQAWHTAILGAFFGAVGAAHRRRAAAKRAVR